MITWLLHLLHRKPIWSTAALFVIGMALIFFTMVFLSNKMNEEMAEQYAENYIQSLNHLHAFYSSEIVNRVKNHGIQITHDYRDHEGAIPSPATFSIQLAELLTNSQMGTETRLYSNFPFTFRKNGGPRDEFESLALSKFRFAADKEKPFVSFEKVAGRQSLRYAKAILMEESCVSCHNTHPASSKTNWKVGDVRGARAVTFPLDTANRAIHKGWAVTLAVMVVMTLAGLSLIFLIIQALRASINLLSQTNSAYNRFIPHEFLGYLKKQSIIEVQLSDNIETQMTVLFSDIRSFTDMSERMTPEENFKFINEYLKVMGPVVRRNNGFIDKYIGDAIMALFDNADDAVKSAIEMLQILKDLNQEREAHDAETLSIGIGLHTGKVRLGTIGEHDRMDSTVISDVVNLASRIEGLTKFYGVQCLISAATYRNLSEPDEFCVRFIDKVAVKGKNVPVDIYEVFSADSVELQARKRAGQGKFEEATRLYAVKEFAKARSAFEQVLSEFPGDRAVGSYIQRCDRYLREGIGEDWNGSLNFEFK